MTCLDTQHPLTATGLEYAGNWRGRTTEDAQRSTAAAKSLIEDRAWVKRVQKGDEEAARALVQRLYPTVMRSIRCHLPRRTGEEDLAQVVFAKIFARLGSFSGTVPLEHWVSRITINTCLNQLKHEKRRPEWRMADLGEEEEAMIQQLVSNKDDLPWQDRDAARELVEKLLSFLKPDERLVIKLLHLDQRSVRDVTKLTGWSASHVKVKAFRTRLKMRKLWRVTLKEQRL
jgi:RNA polymerase sigma-70 factor (ECF subfamily)